MTQGTEQQTFSCQCHPLPLSSRGNYKSLKWKVRWDTVIWILLICLFLVPFSLTWCASTTTSELVPTWSLRLAPSSAHSSLVLYQTGRWHRLRYIRHWSCIGQVNGAVSGTFVIGLVSDRLVTPCPAHSSLVLYRTGWVKQPGDLQRRGTRTSEVTTTMTITAAAAATIQTKVL